MVCVALDYNQKDSNDKNGKEVVFQFTLNSSLSNTSNVILRPCSYVTFSFEEHINKFAQPRHDKIQFTFF